MRRILVFTAFLCLTSGCCLAAPPERGLSLATGTTGKPYLAYGGQPLFAFGPGDEMRLLSGAADVERWAAWQKAHGMNLLRAYPASVPLSAYGQPGLHPFVKVDGGWDVEQWNEAYFEHIGKVAAILEAHDIVLHLQLWQIVWFKGGATRWDINYLNPRNNVNEWTRDFARGRDYIDAPEGSTARAHQREWVERILDAVGHRDNVLIDVINELGNEMGTLAWAVEVRQWIRAWEQTNDRKLIVGVDSENHYRPEVFGPYQDQFDLLILNELKNPEYARSVIAQFNKPAVTVRSSDGRNQWPDYVFANAEQTAAEHQTRYRTLCCRSLFAGAQSIGAYWKPEVVSADYRDMADWPTYAAGLRSFWQRIGPFWPELRPDTELVAGDTITPYAYGLSGPRLSLVYLECGPKAWDIEYPASELTLREQAGQGEVEIFVPRSGRFQKGEWNDKTRLVLPAFQDDLVVLIWR